MQLLFTMVLMFGVLYLTMIRPQKKQMQEKQNLLQSLAKGDSVVTLGGLHGIVDEVDHTNGLVVLDCEGIFLTYELQAIAKVDKNNVTVNDLTAQPSETFVENDDLEDIESVEVENNSESESVE